MLIVYWTLESLEPADKLHEYLASINLFSKYARI